MTKKRFGKREGFFSLFFSKQKTPTKSLCHIIIVLLLLLLLLRAFERAFGAFLLSPLRREENGEVSGDDEETTE
jgi:hypothetical protein